MAFIRHMRRSAVSVGRPGGLITEITWKEGKSEVICRWRYRTKEESDSEDIGVSRSGILSTEGEIARLNEILVPLVKQGQSIHQIYLNNKDELMCGEKTLYNYVDSCLSISVTSTCQGK